MTTTARSALRALNIALERIDGLEVRVAALEDSERKTRPPSVSSIAETSADVVLLVEHHLAATSFVEPKVRIWA